MIAHEISHDTARHANKLMKSSTIAAIFYQAAQIAAIVLTGGVAGILLGVAMSQLIGVLAGWSTIVTTSSIVLAFGVSVAIGIVFGLYPAVRASRLDPVKALHYE